MKIYFLFVLLNLFGGTQSFDIPMLMDAILETNHGRELWWYTPTIKRETIKGAPYGWKGATSCGTVYGGTIYINPLSDPDEELEIVLHELIHLMSNCHGTEHDTEMATADVLAFLVQQGVIDGNQLKRAVSRKVEGCYDPASYRTAAITDEYYCHPLMTMMRGDMTKYPYLLGVLQDYEIR